MATVVTEQSFEQEVLQSEKPCARRLLGGVVWPLPRRGARARPHRGASGTDDLKLVKVNIDEEPAVAARYGVQSIPTMILFKQGEPAAAAIGAQPKSALEKALGLAEG